MRTAANAGEEAPEEDAATRAAIRRLNRAIMASWRDDGDGAYEPDVNDEWTRVKYEFGEACEADDGGEEEDPESETARERRCANRLMDMVEKDVHACVPALEMMQRMDQNIDAFEAFVDDMERRFALGTLPKRDVLGGQVFVSMALLRAERLRPLHRNRGRCRAFARSVDFRLIL